MILTKVQWTDFPCKETNAKFLMRPIFSEKAMHHCNATKSTLFQNYCIRQRVHRVDSGNSTKNVLVLIPFAERGCCEALTSSWSIISTFSWWEPVLLARLFLDCCLELFFCWSRLAFFWFLESNLKLAGKPWLLMQCSRLSSAFQYLESQVSKKHE